MNALASSECSSGCESGWTLYFERSMDDAPQRDNNNSPFLDEEDDESFHEKRFGNNNCGGDDDDDEEEEDLSMVSDASSGPPHFLEEEGAHHHYHHHHHRNLNVSDRCIRTVAKAPDACTDSSSSSGKRQKTRDQHSWHRKKRSNQELPSMLDDTASSPLINFFPTKDVILRQSPASMDSVLEFSDGRSAFQDHFGFMQSTHVGKQNN